MSFSATHPAAVVVVGDFPPVHCDDMVLFGLENVVSHGNPSVVLVNITRWQISAKYTRTVATLMLEVR